MDKDTVLSGIRHLLTFAAGFLASKFNLDGETVNTIIAGIVALFSAFWSVYTATKKSSTVAAAQTVLASASVPVSENQIAVAAATVQK